MNDIAEIQRLTKAIANLATVLIESTVARTREQLADTPKPMLQLPVGPQSPPPGSIADEVQSEPVRLWMNKKDIAAKLRVSVRTVDNMVETGEYRISKLAGLCGSFGPRWRKN